MVTRSNSKLIPLLIVFLSSTVEAQITGLWEATSVQVGEESRTPIAKWTEFHKDGSYSSGNGWLQYTTGSWEYDSESGELSMIVIDGFDDPFGPFKIEMNSDDEMIWIREENGETVVVTNKRVDLKPKHPATLAVGLWMVAEASLDGIDRTEEFKNDEFQAVFVRWDNLLREFTADGTRNGIWRVNAHRPVIDVLYYDGQKPLQYWDMEFENKDSMTWTRDQMIIKFERLTSFPED